MNERIRLYIGSHQWPLLHYAPDDRKMENRNSSVPSVDEHQKMFFFVLVTNSLTFYFIWEALTIARL